MGELELPTQRLTSSETRKAYSIISFIPCPMWRSQESNVSHICVPFQSTPDSSEEDCRDSYGRNRSMTLRYFRLRYCSEMDVIAEISVIKTEVEEFPIKDEISQLPWTGGALGHRIQLVSCFRELPSRVRHSSSTEEDSPLGASPSRKQNFLESFRPRSKSDSKSKKPTNIMSAIRLELG